MNITLLSGKCDPEQALEIVNHYLKIHNIKPSRIITGGFRYLDYVATGLIVKAQLSYKCIKNKSELIQNIDMLLIIGEINNEIQQYIDIAKENSIKISSLPIKKALYKKK